MIVFSLWNCETIKKQLLHLCTFKPPTCGQFLSVEGDTECAL